MKTTVFLPTVLLLTPLARVHAASEVKVAPFQKGDRVVFIGDSITAATEADQRLQANGQGWRLDKAKIMDPARPRVLLIGDSILNGYLRAVIRALEGRAYVDVWVNPYCQSEHLNKLLAQVLEHGPYDVVHFNMGLHGWPEGRIKPGTFEPLTKAYVEVIKTKLSQAKIIWASSTPVTVKGKPTELDPAINPIIVEHNRMAAKVMAELNVPVSDFYSLLVKKLDLARGDQFHWTAPAYELLAKTVVESVLREFGSPVAGARLARPTPEQVAWHDMELETTWNALPSAKARSGVATGFDGDPDGDAGRPNEFDARVRADWSWSTKIRCALSRPS